MHHKKSKEMIHFSGRRHTKTGIFSMIIGIAAVAGFLALSIISGMNGGRGGFVLGLVGLLLFGLSVFGFILSYKAFKKKDIFYRFPIAGAILNGLMTIIFMIVYILGFGG